MRVQILSSSGDLLGNPLISRGCVFLLLFYLYITMSNQVYFQTLVFDIVHAPHHNQCLPSKTIISNAKIDQCSYAKTPFNLSSNPLFGELTKTNFILYWVCLHKTEAF